MTDTSGRFVYPTIDVRLITQTDLSASIVFVVHHNVIYSLVNTLPTLRNPLLKIRIPISPVALSRNLNSIV